MKPIIIKFAAAAGAGGAEVPGWIVPDTEDLFAVDLRTEGDYEAIPPLLPVWAITHLPTGMRLNKNDYTRPAYSYDACDMARRFYEQYVERGWNLKTTDPAEVVAPYKTLSQAEALAFWKRVAGWTEESCSADTSCPQSEKP